MKFPESWLRQHVKTSATRDELAATLTAIGLEVEEMTVIGDVNDYCGKGLSGGRVIVRPVKEALFRAEDL